MHETCEGGSTKLPRSASDPLSLSSSAVPSMRAWSEAGHRNGSPGRLLGNTLRYPSHLQRSGGKSVTT